MEFHAEIGKRTFMETKGSELIANAKVLYLWFEGILAGACHP